MTNERGTTWTRSGWMAQVACVAALAVGAGGAAGWGVSRVHGTQAGERPQGVPAEPTDRTREDARDVAREGREEDDRQAAAAIRTTESGLRYQVTGQAPADRVAREGDVVMVHYTGRLEDGTEFDTSLTPRPSGRRMLVQPFIFPLGDGWVIPGWDEGIAGMAVGERRLLTIPPELAYGEAGAGNLIPPNATLVFEVELVGLWRAEEE